MYSIAVVSVIIYTDYKVVSVYGFGDGSEEDYRKIEYICSKVIKIIN